jgi:hypothetical protein
MTAFADGKRGPYCHKKVASAASYMGIPAWGAWRGCSAINLEREPMRYKSSALLLALCLPAVATAATYDALADWNPNTNTTANIWQYGTETTPGGAFTLFPYHNSNTSTPTYDFWNLANNSNDVGPLIGFNSSGGTINLPPSPDLVWPSDVLQIAPGGSNNGTPENTVLRWVAPSTGPFDIAGQFTDLQQSGKNSTLNMYVQSNSATIFTASYDGSSPYQAAVPFNFPDLSVVQGETIDFITESTGNDGDDALGISATITQSVPEPASIAFLGVGGLMMLRRRRATKN